SPSHCKGPPRWRHTLLCSMPDTRGGTDLCVGPGTRLTGLIQPVVAANSRFWTICDLFSRPIFLGANLHVFAKPLQGLSQYANHWPGFEVPTCQAAGARTNSTGTLPIIFNVI